MGRNCPGRIFKGQFYMGEGGKGRGFLGMIYDKVSNKIKKTSLFDRK